VLYILRTQSGLSQRQLATRIHTQRIYISKVENGVRPTLWSFERYATGLGVSMQKVIEMCEVLAGQAGAEVRE
jgi:transcriptional regulator with XRE-family HTH domain